MLDPWAGLEWAGGITASRSIAPGPVGEDATSERSARFLARTFTLRSPGAAQ